MSSAVKVDGFISDAAQFEGQPYSKIDCAGLIAAALEKYASHTGMTKMYDHDQVVGGQLSSVVELRALPVGTIVGQVGEKGKVKHGGIIVVHDFGDGRGPVKAIYQSCGNNLGGPQYTPIEELGKWNIWLWHDGVTN